jgi:hypothetical protein
VLERCVLISFDLVSVKILRMMTGARIGWVLTSCDDADLAEAGYAFGVRELVARRATQAVAASVDGLILSAAEFMGSIVRTASLVKVDELVISDFLDPGPWDAALRTLALRHDVLCVEVVDPVELELPNVGMLLLHDAVTGREIEVPTGNAKFRERYAHAAANQRATIAVRIRATSADHLVLRTDRDWLLDLARFVSRRRDRIDSLSRSAAHGSGNVGAIAGATLTTGVTR